MAIRAVTKTEFQELMPDEKKRFPEKHVDQKAWFATDDNQFLGVVLYDKFDEEPWCLAVLKKSRKDGKYRLADSELDVTDKKDGIEKLKKLMEEHVAKKPKKET